MNMFAEQLENILRMNKREGHHVSPAIFFDICKAEFHTKNVLYRDSLGVQLC